MEVVGKELKGEILNLIKIIILKGDFMKITGTMSYIKVEINGKTVKIEGEKGIGGFIAYKNTIRNWEPPF